MGGKGSGRKPLTSSPDNRPRLKSPKHLVIDDELHEALHAAADKLAIALGFRPSVQQLIRHLLQKDNLRR